jgi:hypothetical protein
MHGTAVGGRPGTHAALKAAEGCVAMRESPDVRVMLMQRKKSRGRNRRETAVQVHEWDLGPAGVCRTRSPGSLGVLLHAFFFVHGPP